MRKLILVSSILLMIFISGCTSTPSDSKVNNTNTDQIYTKDPSEMVLTIYDMPEYIPEEWSEESHDIKDNSAESGFHRKPLVVNIPELKVNCSVTKYPTILDAKSQYQTMYNKKSSTTSLGNPNVGDEAYEEKVDAVNGLDRIVFRKGNVIAQVECVGTDSIDFAKNVNGKIGRPYIHG